MLSLHTRPAAFRSCKANSSRRSSSATRNARAPLPAAHRHQLQRRLAAFDEQNTGMRSGGPQDLSVGSDVPSSDTNPSMDPAESPTYTKREEQSGLANANMSTAASSSSSGSSDRVAGSSSSSGFHSGNEVLMSAEDGGGFAGSGRDLSDMLNESTGASSSSSSGTTNDDVIDPESARIHAEETPSPNPRVHPIARTAGAAAASAAGTILGAAAGPVGAAAGAALGAAVGRRAADLLGGSDKQAEVYDAGAEPEQVAEDLQGAGEEIKEAAHTVKSKASDLVDRATEKLHNDSGGSAAASGSSSRNKFRNDRGIAFDSGLGDQTTLSTDLGSTDLIFDTESGRMSEVPRSTSSGSESDHRHSKSKVTDFAKSAADRVADAAESLKDSAVDVAETAADRIQDLAGDLPLPEFPPSTTAAAGGDDHDDQDPHAAGGGVRLEDDPTVQAVRDRISGAAERIEAAAADAKEKARAAAAAASERLSGVGDRAAAAADRTTHTAADYGSGATNFGAPETSERVQDLMKKGSDHHGTESGRESGEASPSPPNDTDLTNAGWGTTSAGRDWSTAEAVVKADVGTPTDGPGDISSLGAAAAAGGYGDAAADLDVDMMRSKAGGISGVESKDVGAYATRGLGDPVAGYNKGGRAEGSGVPEGRLAAGGEDAQAAVQVEPESLAAAGTSDSTAARVAEVYGVGADASSGVEEADVYKKEADRKGE